MKYAVCCALLLCAACSITTPTSVVQPAFYTRTPWVIEGQFAPVTRHFQILIDGQPVMAGNSGWCGRTTTLHGRYMGAKLTAFCHSGDFFTNRNSHCELTIDGVESGLIHFQ